MRKMDFILLIDFLTLVAFVVAMIVTYWMFQSIPDTLVATFIPASGLELVLTAVIKVDDARRERKWQLEDRKSKHKNEDEDEEE